MKTKLMRCTQLSVVFIGTAAGLPALAQETVDQAPAGYELLPQTDQVVPVAPPPVEGDAMPSSATADDAAATDEVAGPPAQTPDAAGNASAAAGEPGSTGFPDRDELADAFDRFSRLKEDGMLDEAENAAKLAVEMSIRVSGPESNDTAKALTNLASVQYETRDYEAAQQNFQSAINIYQHTEDQLSSRLINPLRGLGAAQLESGRPDLAEQTFGRAVHISHVNEGPHNVEQIPLLEALAETRLRMGEADAARDAQDMVYALNLRHLDGDAMSLVGTLMRRAKWQHRTGYFLDERATYRRIIRIIEDAKGDEALELIPPLTALAASYFFVDTTDSTSFQTGAIATGEIYYKRAVRIAEENPDSNWKVLAETKLELADYYNFRSDIGRARRNYQEIWELLSADEEKLDFRRQVLEQIHPLNDGIVAKYAGDATRDERQSGSTDIREGSIIVGYDVSDRGRVSNLNVVEATPGEFEDIQNTVLRELRQRVYRPRFVDGAPVDTPGQVFAHTFYYQQSELDALRAAAE